MGFVLYRAQIGERHPMAETMKGFGGGSIVELVERYDGDAFRTIYTVKFAEEVYVLHAFQKKSKKGIATPKGEIELVKQHLRVAGDNYRKRYEAEEKTKGR